MTLFHRSTEITTDCFFLCLHQVQGLVLGFAILFGVRVHQDRKLLIVAKHAMEICQSGGKELKGEPGCTVMKRKMK